MTARVEMNRYCDETVTSWVVFKNTWQMGDLKKVLWIELCICVAVSGSCNTGCVSVIGQTTPREAT